MSVLQTVAQFYQLWKRGSFLCLIHLFIYSIRIICLYFRIVDSCFSSFISCGSGAPFYASYLFTKRREEYGHSKQNKKQQNCYLLSNAQAFPYFETSLIRPPSYCDQSFMAQQSYLSNNTATNLCIALYCVPFQNVLLNYCYGHLIQCNCYSYICPSFGQSSQQWSYYRGYTPAVPSLSNFHFMGKVLKPLFMERK